MGGLIGGTHVKLTKNRITFDLIQIIQFCLQIDDLWRYLHAHTTHWSQSLATEIMNIIHSLFDFLTVDILCITVSFGQFFDIFT